MSQGNLNTLREKLYEMGRKAVPEYVWEWFFRYFAGGSTPFASEPPDLLQNYSALVNMANALLTHKWGGQDQSFIGDYSTPDWDYYFVGDTHGSFQDTFIIVNFLVEALQANPKIKVIFLGDMVDRNPYDFQNLALVLAFWIEFPDNVFIIRGNHEAADVCSRYGFSQHIYEKAGNKAKFTPLWERLIHLFTRLPLGYFTKVGDLTVAALHGGIPFDVNNYRPQKLQELSPQLHHHEAETFDMDPYSQTILWSDPDPHLTEMVAPTPRTGRPRFSEQAFNDFLQLNGFNLLIRGHEKWPEGYKLFFQNRLISLFSTSTYDSRKIGEAKIFRLTPGVHPSQFGNEAMGEGVGILPVEQNFLDECLRRFYGTSV